MLPDLAPLDPDVTTPPLSFSTRPKRRRWVSVVVGVVAVAVVGALLVAGTAGLLWLYAWFQLAPSDVAGLTSQEDRPTLAADGPSAPEGVTTALVAVVEEQDPTLPGEAPLAGPVALVQSGGERGDDVAVVLLPAALPVAVDGEGRLSLEDAHERGGPDRLVQAVVDHTGIAIDHFVAADTVALPTLADVVGDLEVCTPACTTVDAAEVDDRVAAYGAASSPAELEDAFADLVVVLEAVSARVDARAALTSPFATRRAIEVLADRVTTDVALRGAAVLPVADRLAQAGEVAVATLPGVTNPESGQLLVLPEQSEVRFALLREGGVPTSSPEDDDAAVLADVRVSIQNGTGTTGYAAQLEDQLTAAGVPVVGTENAASFDQQRTALRYDADDPLGEVGAVLLAEILGGDVELVAADRPPTFEGEPVTVTVIGGTDLDDEA